MQQVCWPTHEQPVEQDLGISWVEMLCSFVYYAQLMLPIKRKLTNGTEYLQKLDDWQACIVYSVGLGEQSNNFSNLVLQIRKLVTTDPWPQKARGFTRSLYTLGSKQQHYGYLQRPQIPFQRQVAVFLHDHFVRGGGMDTFPCMNDVTLLPTNAEQVTKSWTKALKHVVKGYTAVRNWRKSPQQRISFG